MWYAYGTFVGESITRDTKSDKAGALRVAIIVWLMCSFIVATSYCGILRSFLITPIMNPPISTLEEVLIPYQTKFVRLFDNLCLS